ncbi:MAG TPA: hypothetical protein VFO83_08765, partial [Aggregicoccus sp.]|nr:hypothetical protein [Aggregicoccus sp.]
TSELRLRYGFHARPFLGLDATTAAGNNARAGGLMLDAFATYRLQALPVALHARFEPVSVGLGTGDRHTPGLGYVAATYSADILEVGLGVGALFGQTERSCYPVYDRDNNAIGEQCSTGDNTGVAVQQLLRLGALDGFHLSWTSSILSREQQFVFGSGRGELQVPIHARYALFAAGGGGRSGYAFGEVGVRTLLQGSGGPGSLLLTGSIGGVSLSDGPRSLGGPSLALGLEWRR